MQMTTKKLISSCAAILAAPLILIGCGQPPAGPDRPGTPVAEKDTVPLALPGGLCVVSSEPLDSMGGPFEYQHKEHTILFCCEHCVPEFDRHSEKYLAALEEGTPVNPPGMN
jgi:YHS domain-containing protein